MIENKLEIVIITFNRSNDLDNTLKQLSESPFSNCQITILDNCSEDETSLTCATYKPILDKLRIIRHDKNIGASPNFLRAVELSQLKYTWVLCDDDNYDFSECADIIKAINSEKFDLIVIGSPSKVNWKRGICTTAQELTKEYNNFFITLSFIPSFIYKTNLYDNDCIHKGYQNVHNLFPHFPFINKSFENDFSVYISNKEIIIRGQDNSPGFSGLTWLMGWMDSCLMIKDTNIRKTAVKALSGKISFYWLVVSLIVIEKMKMHTQNPPVLSLFTSSFLVFGFSKDSLILLLLFSALKLPKSVYKKSTDLYFFTKYTARHKTPPNIFKMKINESIDESRR